MNLNYKVFQATYKWWNIWGFLVTIITIDIILFFLLYLFQRLFNFMDLDRSGTVDLDEFADAMMALEELSFGFT